MTNESKREHRKTKHALQKRVHMQHFSTETKLGMTQNQLRKYSRKVTDQLLAGKNPRIVKGEGKEISE